VATLFTTVSSTRTASGAAFTPELALDWLGNDWAILAHSQGVSLSQDIVLSGTADAWVNMQTFWIEIPTYALDSTYDTLEVVFAMRVYAHASASPDCSIRITNDDASIVGDSEAVTETSSTLQGYMTIVWPAASLPTGRVELKVQGRWASDPGTETLYVERGSNVASDAEFFIRIA